MQDCSRLGEKENVDTLRTFKKDRMQNVEYRLDIRHNKGSTHTHIMDYKILSVKGSHIHYLRCYTFMNSLTELCRLERLIF